MQEDLLVLQFLALPPKGEREKFFNFSLSPLPSPSLSRSPTPVRLQTRWMTAVGFEPTQLALVELESTPLDHLGKLP